MLWAIISCWLYRVGGSGVLLASAIRRPYCQQHYSLRPSTVTTPTYLALKMASSQSSSMMSSTCILAWDPRAVLNVNPACEGMTCVGTTQQYQRCGNFISKRDRKRAIAILHQMSQVPLQSSTHDNRLKDLAGLVLCKRDHCQPVYSQVEITITSWKDQIERAQRQAMSGADRSTEAQQPCTTSTTLTTNWISSDLALPATHPAPESGTSTDVRPFAPTLTASTRHAQQTQQRGVLTEHPSPASDGTAGPSSSQGQPQAQDARRPEAQQPAKKHPEHRDARAVSPSSRLLTNPVELSTVYVNHRAATSPADASYFAEKIGLWHILNRAWNYCMDAFAGKFEHLRVVAQTETTLRSQPSQATALHPRKGSITDAPPHA